MCRHATSIVSSAKHKLGNETFKKYTSIIIREAYCHIVFQSKPNELKNCLVSKNSDTIHNSVKRLLGKKKNLSWEFSVLKEL